MTSPATVRVARRESFNAAHQLYDPGLSDAENRRLFGKCANLHGHNYVLEVVVAGQVDQASGYVLDLKVLSDVIGRQVIQDVDHRNLNTDVPWLEGASRRPRTSPWSSGTGSGQSSRTGCCGRSACGRPRRTGPRSVITSEDPARPGRELRSRYTPADLGVLTRDEVSRFAPGGDGDPRADVTLAWELLYRLEPDLYDRLVSAERLHPGVLDWLPRDAGRIVEVGAGAGRLTLELVGRGREVVAIEPAGRCARSWSGSSRKRITETARR